MEQHARAEPAEPDAYSLRQFCVRHNISVPFYYKLKAQGLTPAELRVGTRVLITREAAAAWRTRRTAETATTATP